MPVKCVLIVRHGADVMQRSFTYAEVLPHSLHSVSELLQSYDMRLETMPYQYVVSSPAVLGNAAQKLSRDAGVKAFFSAVPADGGEVTFDITIAPSSPSPETVAAQYVDNDIVGLLIFPPLTAADAEAANGPSTKDLVFPDVVTKTFIIPPTGTLAALRRAIAATLKTGNALVDYAPRIAVLRVCDGGGAPTPVTDDATARELLQTHAKLGTSARLTYTVSVPASSPHTASRRVSGAPTPRTQHQETAASAVAATPSAPSPAPWLPHSPVMVAPLSPTSGPLRVDVRLAATGSAGDYSASFSFTYGKTEMGLLGRFRNVCTSAAAVAQSRSGGEGADPPSLAVVAGGAVNAVASDGELREWMALARESGQPLRVELAATSSAKMPPVASAAVSSDSKGSRPIVSASVTTTTTTTTTTTPASKGTALPPLSASALRRVSGQAALSSPSSTATGAAVPAAKTAATATAAPPVAPPPLPRRPPAAFHVPKTRVPRPPGLGAESPPVPPSSSTTSSSANAPPVVLSAVEAQSHRGSRCSPATSQATTPRSHVGDSTAAAPPQEAAGSPSNILTSAAGPTKATAKGSGTTSNDDGGLPSGRVWTVAQADDESASLADAQDAVEAAPPSVRTTTAPRSPLARARPEPQMCPQSPRSPRAAVTLRACTEDSGGGREGVQQQRQQRPVHVQSYVRLVGPHHSGSGAAMTVTAESLVMCQLPGTTASAVGATTLIDELLSAIAIQFGWPHPVDKSSTTLVLREVDAEKGLVESVISTDGAFTEHLAQMTLSSSALELYVHTPAATRDVEATAQSFSIPLLHSTCYTTPVAALDGFAARVYVALQSNTDSGAVSIAKVNGLFCQNCLAGSRLELPPSFSGSTSAATATSPVSVDTFSALFREVFATQPGTVLDAITGAVLRGEIAIPGRAYSSETRVEAQLQASLHDAIDELSAEAVEAFAHSASTTPSPQAAASVALTLASVLGALLAPLPCPSYAHWLCDHFRGRLATILFAKMRSFVVSDTHLLSLPLHILTMACWAVLKLACVQLPQPAWDLQTDPVANGLMYWCLAALQLVCAQRHLPFPPLPPHGGLDNALRPVEAGLLSVVECSLGLGTARLQTPRVGSSSSSSAANGLSPSPAPSAKEDDRGAEAHVHVPRSEKRCSKVQYRYRYQSHPTRAAAAAGAPVPTGSPGAVAKVAAATHAK